MREGMSMSMSPSGTKLGRERGISRGYADRLIVLSPPPPSPPSLSPLQKTRRDSSVAEPQRGTSVRAYLFWIMQHRGRTGESRANCKVKKISEDR